MVSIGPGVVMTATLDIEPLAARLYEAALDPALWPTAWAEATASVRDGAALMVVAEGAGASHLATPGWSGHAITRTALAHKPAPALAEPAPEENAVAVRRASAAQRARVVHLKQHLRRAIRVRSRLALAHAVQAASAAALRAGGTGVVLITAGGRLMHADSTAEHLADLVGLNLHARQGGRLVAADPAVTTYLYDLVHDAAAGGTGGDMLFRGRDGSAVAVTVSTVPFLDGEAPVTNEADPSTATPPQVMLTLRRLVNPLPCPRRVAALFGLTRAEADVAVAVAAGQALTVVAECRGVSPTTVQAQVRSVLGKAKVAGVQELGMLFARLG